MVTYCFSTGDGEVFERSFPVGKAPETIRVGRKLARRDYRAESASGTVKGSDTPIRSRGWPMAPCYASGVHASQAQELRNFYRKHGMNIEVTNDGDPVYESAAQRKKALKVRGLHDRNSFS